MAAYFLNRIKMMKFFKKHPDLSLVGLTLIFLLSLAAIYFWGISTLASELNRVIGIKTSSGTSGSASFKIDKAKNLDLKGLVQ